MAGRRRADSNGDVRRLERPAVGKGGCYSEVQRKILRGIGAQDSNNALSETQRAGARVAVGTDSRVYRTA